MPPKEGGLVAELSLPVNVENLRLSFGFYERALEATVDSQWQDDGGRVR
jgi:hypothetical protein